MTRMTDVPRPVGHWSDEAGWYPAQGSDPVIRTSSVIRSQMCNVERLKSRNLTPNAACVHCEFERRENQRQCEPGCGVWIGAAYTSFRNMPSLPGASLGKSLSLKSGYEERVQIQIQKQIPPVPCLFGVLPFACGLGVGRRVTSYRILSLIIGTL